MSKIPVLNDGQMQRLRGLLGSNRSVNLRPDKKQSSRRLPTIKEEEEAGLSLSVLVTAPSGAYGVGEAKAITMNTDGTYAITSGGAVISTITPYI